MAERIIKVKVVELVRGDIIAKDVYSPSGGILVTKNTDVDEVIMQRLLRSYNDYLFVYRKVSDNFDLNQINIHQILIDEIEYIINQTAKRFLKQNQDIEQIKKIILDILKNNYAAKLLMPIRPLGESVFNHSINVTVFALCVGKEMHIPYNRLKVLGTAALFHDIGMSKIPRQIIFKEETLNDNEKKLLRMHPRFSFEILQQTDSSNLEIGTIILQHHERQDGKGYPNAIKGDKIHQMAKILNICDIFEALTNDRPYRQKFEKNESLEYLLSAGDNNYHSEIIQGLINSISIYPFGKWVMLSTGEAGIIASQEEENSLNYRPRVMIYLDKEGKSLPEPSIIDLALRGNNHITIEKML